MCPMPPSTTMASTMTDSMREKLSGETKPCMAEKMPRRCRRSWPHGEGQEFDVAGVDADRLGRESSSRMAARPARCGNAAGAG